MSFQNISGEFYDYTKTLKPEKPYIHDYTKCFTMKLLLSLPTEDNGTNVVCSIEDALDLIKKVDKLTFSIKKIIYLVGWQYNGHDDKYPAFFEVNEALKRPQDKSANDSLIWLMDEALKYNTTVSFHINMTDAYKDSPLWEEYIKNELIAKKDDEYYAIGTWGANKTAYQVWYKNEWEKGFAAKRIDELVSKFPLKRAGTIHIDAFICRDFDNSSLNEERFFRRKYFRYFRELGIDATSEFLYDCPGRDVGELPADIAKEQGDDLIGLMPMAWHINQSEESYLSRPVSLFCGGAYNKDLDINHSDEMGYLVGNNVHGEVAFRNYKSCEINWEKSFLKEVCLKGIPCMLQNKHRLLKFQNAQNTKEAVYSDGLIVSKDKITKNDIIFKKGSTIFMPIVWQEDVMIAYSEVEVKDKKFDLPEDFRAYKTATLYNVNSSEFEFIRTVDISNKEFISLSLNREQALYIKFR